MPRLRKGWWIVMAMGLRAATPWDELRARNPPGLKFELRLAQPHVFRQGELIRIESTRPAQAQEWQFAGFLIDPPAAMCGVVTKPCFGPAAMIIRNGPMPHEPPDLLLNQFVPVLPPGGYRVAGLMQKLVVTSRSPGQVSVGYADPPRYLVSNTVLVELKQA